MIRGHLTSVRDVAFSPSGRHIISAAIDGEVKLWSALNGTQVCLNQSLDGSQYACM